MWWNKIHKYVKVIYNLYIWDNIYEKLINIYIPFVEFTWWLKTMIINPLVWESTMVVQNNLSSKFSSYYNKVHIYNHIYKYDRL